MESIEKQQEYSFEDFVEKQLNALVCLTESFKVYEEKIKYADPFSSMSHQKKINKISPNNLERFFRKNKLTNKDLEDITLITHKFLKILQVNKSIFIR